MVNANSVISKKQNDRNNRYRQLLRFKKQLMSFIWGIDVVSMLHLAAGSIVFMGIFAALAYFSIFGRNIIASVCYAIADSRGDDEIVILIDRVEFVINILGIIGFVTVLGMFYNELWLQGVKEKSEVKNAQERIDQYRSQLDGIYKDVGSKKQIQDAVNQIEVLELNKDNFRNSHYATLNATVDELEIKRDAETLDLKNQKNQIVSELEKKYESKIASVNLELKAFFGRKSNRVPSLTIGEIIDEDGNAKPCPRKICSSGGLMKSHADYHRHELDVILSKYPAEFKDDPRIKEINGEILTINEKYRAKIDETKKIANLELSKKLADIDNKITEAKSLALYEPQIAKLIENINNAREQYVEILETAVPEKKTFAIPTVIANAINSFLPNKMSIEVWMIPVLFFLCFFLAILGILRIINKTIPYAKTTSVDKEKIDNERMQESKVWKNITIFVSLILQFLKNWFKRMQLESERKLRESEKGLKSIDNKFSVKKRATRVPTLSSNQIVQPSPAFNSKSVMTAEEFEIAQKSKQNLRRFRNAIENNGDAKSKKIPLKQKSNQFDLDF